MCWTRESKTDIKGRSFENTKRVQIDCATRKILNVFVKKNKIEIIEFFFLIKTQFKKIESFFKKENFNFLSLFASLKKNKTSNWLLFNCKRNIVRADLSRFVN